MGGQVLTAGNAALASAMIEQWRPRVVFVDLAAGDLVSPAALLAYRMIAPLGTDVVAFGSHVDADALAEIMAGEETTLDGNTDDDAVPEVSATPISRPGDVWEMGNHRLVCGDATDPKSYELLMKRFAQYGITF